MDKKASISFVMPMYNEEANISRAIDKIREVAAILTEDYEIVIVDDCSTDDSAHIVEAIAKEDIHVKLIRLARNTKFGGAFARGFKEASKDIIMYMDSDLPVGMDDITESFPLMEGADIVTGHSKISKGETFLRKVISHTYNLIVQTLFGLRIRDINSGYKIVRRSLIKDLEFISESPFIDVELFLCAKKNNAKVIQYPLIFYPRDGGRSYIASMPIILATFRDMFKVWFKSVLFHGK